MFTHPHQIAAAAEQRRRTLAAYAQETAEPPKPIWTPQHRRDCAGGEACKCPQVLADTCKADVIGYGGQAGGGKTDLLLGSAGTRHERSVIFRRVFPSLRGMIERSREIFNAEGGAHSKDSYNESLHVWRLRHDIERMIEFGAVQYDKDKKKWQGQPHDFVGVDEATEFPEAIVRFFMGWNRSAKAHLKCQMMLTFNPPIPDENGDLQGEWIIKFFAPWLDEQHPRPAKDGELRWYASLDGQETELENGEPFDYTDKVGHTRRVVPKSRTFFHASLSDNPILEETGYGATIDALPEPLRSILQGSFKAGMKGNPWQVIPTEWVKAAQRRWQENPPVKMGAVGADIARGGADKLVIARQHGQWFNHLLKYPGVSIPDGATAAALIIQAIADNPVIGIDILNVGYSAYDSLIMSGNRAIGVNFGAGSDLTDKSGRYKFRNIRAECYWKFREALDPETGSDIALPPDSELLADLCAPRWGLNGGKIQIEEKKEIVKRLGRSPDCGDAVVIAYYADRNNIPLFLSGDDD